MADNFAGNFLAGAQVANMRAMRTERMMQLKAEQSLQAVQERQLAAQAEMVAAHSQLYQQQAEQEKKDQADTLANSALYKQELESGEFTEDQASQRAVRRMMAINPPLGLKQAQALMDLKKSSIDAQPFTPQVMQPIDSATGKPAVDEMGRPLRAMTTGKGSAIAIDREPTQVSTIKHFVDEYNKAVQGGNNDLAEALKGGLTKATTGSGFSLKTNPDGTFELTQGQIGGPDALTKTNQSKVQELQAKALDTIDTAERLLPLLTNETVGLEAFAKSWVNDRILSQKFPELASNKRAQASQLINELRASSVANLKSDGNISDRERNEILENLPKANAPIDSPARAKMVVQQTQVTAAIQAMKAAKRLGGELPKAAILILDDENVADMAKRGVISTDLAQKIWKMKRQ